MLGPVAVNVPRVSRVDVVGPYRLRVSFTDATTHDIDCMPLLVGDWFGQLRDPEKFAAVAIDDVTGGVKWPAIAGLDPWTLHDWPTAGPARIAWVQKTARISRRLAVFRAGFVVCGSLLLAVYLAQAAGLHVFGDDPPSPLSATLLAAMVLLNAVPLIVRRRRRAGR